MNESEKYDIVVHYGTCDSCLKRNVLVTHFNYSKQQDTVPRDFRLCPKCTGRSLIALSHPLKFRGKT